MSDANFEGILEVLRKIHGLYPTLRFGEVIQVAVDRFKLTENFNLTNITSKQMLNYLCKYHDELARKKEKENAPA